MANNDLTNNGRNMSGVIKLAEALKENHSVVELKYAPSQCLRIPLRANTLEPHNIDADLLSFCVFAASPATV